MLWTCPHCQYSIERAGGDLAEEILCPRCGRASRRADGATEPAIPAADRREPRPVAIGQTLSHYLVLEPLGGAGSRATVPKRRVFLHPFQTL